MIQFPSAADEERERERERERRGGESVMSAKEYYHLIPESEWRSCVSESRPYFPATYDADGFTHLSDNTGVLLTIGNHFYKQIKGK